MEPDNPSLRFFSPDLKFILFANGDALWCRKDLRKTTAADNAEARAILELLLEDEGGNC